jgi:hypothetical protein
LAVEGGLRDFSGEWFRGDEVMAAQLWRAERKRLRFSEIGLFTRKANRTS